MRRLDEVVARHEPAVVVHAAGELFELERDEPAVVAELDDVTLDLVGDAAHHLGALEHGRDVAQRDEVLDLEGRQRAGDAVEPRLVPAEDLERLVGAGEHSRDGDERALVPAVVDRHDAHLFRDGEHRHLDLARDALGGAVAGPGLGGRDVGVGNEVDVGAGDARAVGREDDRAVHLGELRQALRGELGVEEEAAGADVEHRRARRRRRSARPSSPAGCGRYLPATAYRARPGAARRRGVPIGAGPRSSPGRMLTRG